MASITESMREAWAAYRCQPGKMQRISFGPDEIRVAPETVEAWKALETVLAAHRYDIRIEDTDSYNCREIKSGGAPSLHSYGIALDINWKTNPYLDHSGSRKPRFSDRSTQAERANDVRIGKADTDMTRAMVDAALAIRTLDGTRVLGWGGDWRTVKDAMHFQIEATPDQLKAGIDWSTVEGMGVPPPHTDEADDSDATTGLADLAPQTGGRGMALPKVFFDTVRRPLFNGSLSQSAVDNMNLITDFWFENFPGNPLNQLAYVLATVRAEVGANMRPVRETFASSDAQARQRLAHKQYGRPAGPFGHCYYGRGYVQLTWLRNYEAQSRRLGIDLVQNPDLALQTPVAIKILTHGMMEGDFNAQGHGLSFYVNETKQDFVNARRTVNILDRAQEIAGFARKFLEALQLSVQSGFELHTPVAVDTQAEGQVMDTSQGSGQLQDLIALFLRRLLAADEASRPSPTLPQTDQNAQLTSLMTAVLNALAAREGSSPAAPAVGGDGVTIVEPQPPAGEKPPLTPVNAALGQTVGRMLDGKKTVIGIGTILATVFLPPLAPFVPALGEVLTTIGDHQNQILPIAGAGTLWGALGKIDKWFAFRR